MTAKQKRQALKDLKRGANFVKSDLIRLSNAVREVSPRQAERLDRIIFRLEMWQQR